MGYGEVGKRLHYGCSLCAGTLEESPPRRHVIEEPINQYGSASGVRSGGDGDVAATVGCDVRPCTFAGRGGKGECTDAGYGGQRLPAETQGHNSLYVCGCADLACSVPQDAQLGICFAHPRAIVPDQYALAATVSYLYLYARGTSVQGVLCELLYHRGGAVDDLSCGDLLCFKGIQHLYGACHGFLLPYPFSMTPASLYGSFCFCASFLICAWEGIMR